MSKHNLYSDALDLAPVDFDFGEGYGDRWEVVYPGVDDWGLRKCSAYLEDEGYGGDPPEPNPFAMDREAIIAHMKADDIAIAPGVLPDEEDDEWDRIVAGMTDEGLKERLIEAIDDEETDGIEDWRSAVRDHMQGDGADAFAPMMNYYYPLPNLGIPPEAAQERVMGTSCVVVLVDGEPVLALAGGGMDLSPDICKAYVALGYYPPMHFASGLPRLGTAYREITPELIDICVEGAEIALRRAQNNLDDLRRFADELAARTA